MNGERFLAYAACLACVSCGPSAKPAEPGISIPPATASAQMVDPEGPGAYARALAALDGAKLAEASAAIGSLARGESAAPGAIALAAALDDVRGRGKSRSFAFANVAAITVAKLPPARARATGTALLPATRTRGPAEALREIPGATSGRVFSTNFGEFLDEASVPAFLPSHLGEANLRRLRASDGRFLAFYDGRFVAIFAADGSLNAMLDFAAWDKRAAFSEHVEWGELAGDTLYVRAQLLGTMSIVAVDVRSGAVLWRSEPGTFCETFALTSDAVITWSYGDGKVGEIVALNRSTGVAVSRRKTPEISIPGNPSVIELNGNVAVTGSNGDGVSAHLAHDELLALPRAVLAHAPPPAEPPVKNGPLVASRDARQPSDARLRAWQLLDREADPRAAILALRPFIAAHPCNFAAGVLLDAAFAALKIARVKSAEAIRAMPARKVVTGDTPSGLAAIARPQTRKLRATPRAHARTEAAMVAEIPVASDLETLPPAWVPDKLGHHARKIDATGQPTAERRVEAYSRSFGTTFVVAWTAGKVSSLLEYDSDVRFVDSVDGAIVVIAGDGKGVFYMEARDAKTGATNWRAPVTGESFLAQDGYIVASDAAPHTNAQYANPRADITLIEGDTGKIVAHAGLKAPQDMFLLFRKESRLIALNSFVVVSLSLE